MQAQRQTRGFTLVEVLVALFVLAVGIAGAGATQLTAQRLRQHAALSSEAAQLAASLAARMRANATIAGLPDAVNPYLGFRYDAADGAPSTSLPCFGSSSCTPAQLAAFDLLELRRALHAQFPGGRITVCRDGAPWDSAASRFRWSCDNDAGALPVVKLGWHGTLGAPGYVTVLR
ncbi:type IV pilus modification protein PilV [Massilia sp. H6]|uniref:type IV pilus modification protein PilV n=1 Tax=Massilia sp. H6 TaxID=2970464 RepID=UPI002167ED4D|nr:type IV pilus modification protein PilV [Massilia sp. H6]UVW30087.1 type IV pilus modification protein PilV [Massilia sp. H6]